MATIISLGSAKRENLGSGINLLGVTIPEDGMVIATVGFMSGTDGPTCKFNDEKMFRTGQRLDSTNGFGVSTFISRKMEAETTANIAVDWSADLGARVIAAYSVSDFFIEDQITRNLMTASDTPHTGYTEEHSFRDSLAWGVLCANGPEGDTAPLIEVGWTTGLRKGTTLATATDNVTINIFYQELTTADPARCRGTNATIRNWSNTLSILRPVIYPILDKYEYEIKVGGTVDYFGSPFTVSAITRIMGTIGIITLSDGNNVWSYDCVEALD